LQISFPDNELEGFSPQAREELEKAANQYLKNVVQEASRIEAGRNMAGGAVEITQAMVNDAVVLQRRGLGGRPKTWRDKISRIVAAITSLIVGILYDSAALQDPVYMGVFVTVIAIAILSMTISIIQE
jgi:hypothetical protein